VPSHKKVLVTGAYGLVGNVIYRKLAQSPESYDLYGLSRRRHPSARLPDDQTREIPDDHLFIADLGDASALQKAVVTTYLYELARDIVLNLRPIS